MHYSIVNKAHVVLSYSCFNAFLFFLYSNITDETCSINNGGCAHLCINNTNGYIQCGCRAGYRLDGNGENCNGENIFDHFTDKQIFKSSFALVCYVTDV